MCQGTQMRLYSSGSGTGHVSAVTSGSLGPRRMYVKLKPIW